ncbi:hypothetical protein [Exiguobacterium flavidum]|uniref:hypothetical protein n=1 Tax=Exiguobacterium flavidum TaxID=2184695 RepID=UPI000DF816F3|nr:hypothetical protein [Exiguobacterium flavidum]
MRYHELFQQEISSIPGVDSISYSDPAELRGTSRVFHATLHTGLFCLSIAFSPPDEGPADHHEHFPAWSLSFEFLVDAGGEFSGISLSPEEVLSSANILADVLRFIRLTGVTALSITSHDYPVDLASLRHIIETALGILTPPLSDGQITLMDSANERHYFELQFDLLL